MVVEGKFRACEVSVLVGLIGRDVVTDVGTNVAIRILYLSVRLRVVSGAEIEEGSQLAEEFPPKVGSEAWIAVGDSVLGMPCRWKMLSRKRVANWMALLLILVGIM